MYEYNPIVRTFNQVRAAILAATDTPRCRIRPSATLESVIPPTRWGAVGVELQRRGLPGPPWMTPPSDAAPGCVQSGAVASVGQMLGGSWLLVRLGRLVAAPLTLLLGMADFVPDVEWYRGRWTVGDLAVYCTCFPAHKASGYRWARGDIALKVRLIIAEALGVPLERITEATSFVEDLAAD